MMRKLSGMKDREKKNTMYEYLDKQHYHVFFDESNFKRKLHGNCQSIVLSTKTAVIYRNVLLEN